MQVKIGVRLRHAGEVWGLSTLYKWIFLGSVYGMQFKFWGLSTLCSSNLGVCLRYAGEIWCLSTLCRWNLVSVYAMQVNFWCPSTLHRWTSATVYALQVNFWGLSTLCRSIFCGLPTVDRWKFGVCLRSTFEHLRSVYAMQVNFRVCLRSTGDIWVRSTV